MVDWLTEAYGEWACVCGIYWILNYEKNLGILKERLSEAEKFACVCVDFFETL